MRHDAFERLYREHAEPLLAFLVYRTGERALAEDLLADTFERVLRARRPFDPRRASEKTWLYSIALNCLRDQARRRFSEMRALTHVRDELVAESGSSCDVVVEDRDALRGALNELSPEEAEAIALRYGGDLTNPEIAKVLGQKLATVESRVYRGLGKLRALLGE